MRSVVEVTGTLVDDIAAGYIAAREVVQKVNAPTAYNVALECIDRCLQHERCPPPLRTPLPTRVLDGFVLGLMDFFAVSGRLLYLKSWPPLDLFFRRSFLIFRTALWMSLISARMTRGVRSYF